LHDDPPLQACGKSLVRPLRADNASQSRQFSPHGLSHPTRRRKAVVASPQMGDGRENVAEVHRHSCGAHWPGSHTTRTGRLMTCVLLPAQRACLDLERKCCRVRVGELLLARDRAFPQTVVTRSGRAGKAVKITRGNCREINLWWVDGVELCSSVSSDGSLESGRDLR
jgi:hypothetical protein